MKACRRFVMQFLFRIFRVAKCKTISLYRLLFSWCFSAMLRLRGVWVGKGGLYCGRPLISLYKDSSIVIGDNLTLRSSVNSNPLGCNQPVIIRTILEQAKIYIGNNVGCSATSICAAKEIHIEDGVLFGAGAMIMDNDFHIWKDDDWCRVDKTNPVAVKIGKKCFIGSRAIILKGVELGDCCVVGAGAVVKKGHYPAGSVLAGNPARVVQCSKRTL
ncbi:acyltransferase [Verrucomicrobia bacterium S94]|nr:acyltransferase [Verrucomicrobia bacterium S94]